MLKRICAFFTAAVIAVMIPLGVFAESSTLQEIAYREVSIPVPCNVTVMGDSIATGFGLEGYAAGKGSPLSYANILKDKYSKQLPSDCTFELTNFAVDGYTSDDLLKLLDSGKCDEALSKAGCVLISIGGNDLLHALWDTLKDAGITYEGGEVGAKDLLKILTSLGKLKKKLDENLLIFDQNLPKIASYIRTKSKGEFFIQTLYDPLESFSMIPGISSIAKDKIGRLNEIIKGHAGDPAAGYSVCDVAPEFVGKANELTNIGKIDIHPNAQGHKLISEVLDKAITAKKYSYMQEYVIERKIESEPADAASVDSAVSLQGNSTVMIAVICSVCAMAAGAAAMYLIIKKRR